MGHRVKKRSVSKFLPMLFIMMILSVSKLQNIHWPPFSQFSTHLSEFTFSELFSGAL